MGHALFGLVNYALDHRQFIKQRDRLRLGLVGSSAIRCSLKEAARRVPKLDYKGILGNAIVNACPKEPLEEWSVLGKTTDS